MGGEKTHEQQLRAAYEGSPPRGRRKVLLVCTAINSSRITPAWAGKSPEFRLPYLQSEDHPRVGGEKYIIWSRSCIR